MTTRKFLEHFGLDTLCDLPDLEEVEDAGLLSRSAAGVDFAPTDDEEGSDPPDSTGVDLPPKGRSFGEWSD